MVAPLITTTVGSGAIIDSPPQPTPLPPREGRQTVFTMIYTPLGPSSGYLHATNGASLQLMDFRDIVVYVTETSIQRFWPYWLSSLCGVSRGMSPGARNMIHINFLSAVKHV